MLILEPKIVFARRFFIVVFCLFLANPISAQDLSGVWISPDWYFPGNRQYTELEVRNKARAVFRQLSRRNVDSVFLETFLRGYGICPTIEMSPRARTATVIEYSPGTDSHPVYPHLTWDYQVEFGTVLDPLQIFVEEGQAAGIDVHAWVHLFYWRMDNTDIMLPWHDGPSLWGHLMEEYLRDQADRLDFVQAKDIRPGYEDLVNRKSQVGITVELIREAADIFSRGCNTRQLERLLKTNGIDSDGHPMGALISAIIGAGGQRPDFVLMADDSDPFPAPRGKHLRSVYVNPEHPKVRKALVSSIANIAQTHPGLAGVHLDHIRYPVDGQGLTPETGVIDGKYRYFNAADSREMDQYRELSSTLKRRQNALNTLVDQIAAKMPRRMKLSAAVLPLYYRDRDNGKFRTSGYDYSSQAWVNWPVDFVVPMMYEYHPYLIRSLVKQYQKLADQAQPESPIQVYPGISRERYTRDGSVGRKGWVFFDLSLARDIKNPRRETEDLDFGE